jgi:hypothetical protein
MLANIGANGNAAASARGVAAGLGGAEGSAGQQGRGGPDSAASGRIEGATGSAVCNLSLI